MRIFSLVILVALCTNSAMWAGDGLVALQTADPSCPDDSGNIYVDCGNGTVTDNRTGLVWLQNADCIDEGAVDWYTAMEFVAGLSDLPGSDPDDCGLSDGSSPGEWRLPSKAEWDSMVEDALGQGGDPDCIAIPPTITTDSGNACWLTCVFIPTCSFSGVQSHVYWSSTTNVADPPVAWVGSLFNGNVGSINKTDAFRVWPVRGGQ